MRGSIRKFLFISLLAIITLTSTLTATGYYYLHKREAYQHLDSLLYFTTLTLRDLVGKHPDQTFLKILQKKFDDYLFIAQNGTDNINHANSPVTTGFQKKYEAQIWSKDNRLLLRSPGAPTTSFTNAENGFHNITVENQKWRVLTQVDSVSGLRFAVALLESEYYQLAELVDQSNLYLLLLIYVISGTLVWFAIGYSLRSLKRITEEISRRAPDRLESVPLDAIPNEIKPLVEELNQLFFRLQHAIDKEQRFAADAAHELRTPLAAIKTQAQVALKTAGSPEQCNILNNVINGVDRCAHIVRQLLTLSRLAPGSQYPAEITNVNILKLITEVIAQLDPALTEHKTSIELTTPDPTLSINTDETILSLLVRNLIDNAIRYTPVGSHIQVIAMRDAGRIVLQVRDNGPGIPDELRARVFERFYRVIGNKSTGSGLGLAIVQHIASLFGGTVALGIPPTNVGLEVTVSFPDTTCQSPAA